MSATGDKAKTYMREDIVRTKEDLESIEELFIEAVRRTARRSGEVGKEVLNDLADRARETTSDLKVKAAQAAETATGRLKEFSKDAAGKAADLTGKAARATAEEAKELSKRSFDIAKGALSGMWKGAKEALKKGKEEQ
jgi:phage-related tail protein